jgi:hypothetical protein
MTSRLFGRILPLIFALSLALSACRTAEVSTSALRTPQKRDYQFDIKTEAGMQSENFGIKSGLIGYIENAEPRWATIVEFGETHVVWIRNVQRKMSGKMLNVEFDLILAKPTLALFVESDVIKRRRIVIPAFDRTTDPKDGDATISLKLRTVAAGANISRSALAWLTNLSEKTGDGATITGVLGSITKALPSSESVQQQRSEGAIIGGIAFAHLHDMILNLEDGK